MRLWWTDWRSWSAGSPNRRILTGAVIVGSISILAKMVAVTKEMTIAAYFGRSDEIEAFLIAILLPQMLGGVIGSSFTGAVVPALARVEQTAGRAASDRLFGEMIGAALPLLLILSSLIVLFGGHLLPFIAGGFAPEKLDLTRHLLVAAAPMTLLGALGVMLSAPFHGRERFAASALAPAVTPFMVLGAVVALGGDLDVLVIATIAGGVAEIGLLLIVLWWTGHHIRPLWPRITGEVRATLAQWWPAIIASCIYAGTALIDQVMAAHLVAGSVAALSYGQRLVMIPVGLMIGTIAPVVLAVLAQRQSSKVEMMHVADWWRRRLLWASALGSVLVMISAEPLTFVVFERGTFSSKDTAEVALVVAALAPMAPWYLLGAINARVLNLLGGNRYLPIMALTNLGVGVCGNLMLAPRLGIAGVALASSLVYLVSFLQIEWCIYRLRGRHVRSRVSHQGGG